MINRLAYVFLSSLLFAGCSPATTVSSSIREAALADLEAELKSTPGSAEELRDRLDRVLEAGLSRRRMSSQRNAAWQIMHGVVCYGETLQIDTPDRGLMGALEYGFSGGQIQGFQLMPGAETLPSTGHRGVKARLEPGSYVGQGHVDQWIAILAMANIPLDTPIVLGEETFSVADLARQAQYDVTRNLLDEYSWTLIALTHYFPDEPRWSAAENLEVSWEVLVEQELAHDIDLSPCGGTHRLAGIVRALNAKQRLGLPDSPTWQRASALVDNLLDSVREHRGADGRLSSFYFTRAGGTADLSAELSSTGHLFEFAALACSDEELDAPWLSLSANRLCELFESTERYDLDCGALYHALNGLKIYRQRRFANAETPPLAPGS